MEWYTLDDNLRRDTVIEGFESFAWTERYFAWGEFQIVIRSTYDSRSLLKTGVRVGKLGSNRVMTIETVNETIDEEGKKILTVTGRSIEAWLEDRVGMRYMEGTETVSHWTVSGLPAELARYFFDQVCVQGVLDAGDSISFYHAGTLSPSGSIPEPTELVTVEFEHDNLYNDIKAICERWNLGFRFVKNGDLGEIYFEVYTGHDRTSAQSVNSPVIFSRDMESIDKTTTLWSIAGSKNVAYVYAKNGAAIVYPPDVNPSISGSDRKILLVKADDIDLAAGSDLNAAITRRGLSELAKYQDIYGFDGQIPQYHPYVYGTDYGLGDLIEERNSDGLGNYMLVIEQIFISDSEGEREYPTLMLSKIIVPGSWQAEPSGEHWADVPLDVHWIDK